MDSVALDRPVEKEEVISQAVDGKAVGNGPHWVLRYGLALLLFGLIVGLAFALRRFEIQLNFTIPVVIALAATAWYGGFGPGLLLSVLFQATTVFYAKVPPETSMPRLVFGYFSVFSLYVFLTFVISRFRKIQDRLRSHRDLLQVTLSSIGDAVIATDTSGHITFMNSAAQRLTGWMAAEAVGMPLNQVMHLVNEETREELKSPVDRVLESGEIVGLANHTVLVSRDGTEIPIDDSAAPIRDREGIRGVVLVFSDVTQRKMAERSRRTTEMMQRVVEAQEAERRRIARDLHDHLGQRMTALRLRLESLTEKCADHPELETAVEDLQSSALQIDRDIGFLSWELRPTELENLGLADALKSYVREWSNQHDISAEFYDGRSEKTGNIDRIPAVIETNLYRIAQEALNNVLKHANASSVSVLLQQQQHEVMLIVEDDGTGFDIDTSVESTSRGGLGLVGMRERASLLNGTLEIDSDSGSGTTVMVRIPMTPEKTLAVGVGQAA